MSEEEILMNMELTDEDMGEIPEVVEEAPTTHTIEESKGDSINEDKEVTLE
jgi:hypothetical protein